MYNQGIRRLLMPGKNDKKDANTTTKKVNGKASNSSTATSESKIRRTGTSKGDSGDSASATREKVYSKSTILLVSALSYVIFFLPFLVCKNEPFARFHLNQALLLWITFVILYLAFMFIPNVNIIVLPFIIMLHLLGIIAGVNSALRGIARKLPLIGRIKIINWEKCE